MRIVLVLGAGASLAQATRLHDLAFSGESPPLDASFFKTLCDLGIKAPQSLRGYAEDLYGADPFTAGTAKPRMEEFFKDLFYDFINEQDDEEEFARLYGQMVVAYRQVLLETTNWVCGEMREGPVPRLVGHAADAAKNLDVVTFNHDLVVENALAQLDPRGARWCLRHGYGQFAAKRRFTVSKGADGFPDPEDCRHKSPIRIYKLHGSLNWYFDTDAAIPDASVLRGERGTNQRVYATLRRTIPPRLRRAGHFSWPVLIPPIYVKQPFIRNFMAGVWEDARKALRACHRLAFFGYSMPQFDVEAEKEFQRAVAHNERLRYIDVINPDTDAASRFAGVFPRMSVRWFGDVMDYLNASPFAE